jgi:hypothetical protein
VEVDQPLTISALEFDVLWEHLGLEDMPVVLRVDSPGGTHSERDRLVQAAWRSLEGKGYGRPVDLDPRLARMLRVLERPDAEVDARLWLDAPVRVLVAIAGDYGVHATLAENRLTLREASLSGPAREVLTALPEKPAGPGESVTLRSAQFEEAAGAATSPAQFAAALGNAGVRRADVESLRKMIDDTGFQGQFGAAARDKWGARVRADHVVSFFDTEAGRYVQIRKPSAGGDDWTTIGPVDPRRMHQHVSSMFDDVRAAAARR